MGKAASRGKQATNAPRDSAGVETTAWTEGICRNHGKPSAAAMATQPAAREGQAGPRTVAERLVVAAKPGNSGGAKGPQFKDQRQ